MARPSGTVHVMEQEMIENKQGVFAPAGELRTSNVPPAKQSVKAGALAKGTRK